ncbi:hypothetical protein C8R45DRAFT_946843 [Mycena sanguinolenta]|nr:hypothetical protein C8R45DRAFT_946843 [Mycena sanguinolenta]
MNPPAAVKITTTTVMCLHSELEDSSSIASQETIMACTGISAGTDSRDADVKPILAAGADLQAYMGCGSETSDPDEEHKQNIGRSSPYTSQNLANRYLNGPAQENREISANCNSDATCIDMHTQLTSYDPCFQHFLLPTPTLRESTTNNPCLAPFWCNVTPERPLPLEPATSPLQGKLIDWWCMMEFQWEREGWAFVLMKGPIPRIQHEANLIADHRMTQRQQMHAEHQACQTLPPPPSTPVGSTALSTPVIWHEDVEGMFVMDVE